MCILTCECLTATANFVANVCFYQTMARSYHQPGRQPSIWFSTSIFLFLIYLPANRRHKQNAATAPWYKALHFWWGAKGELCVRFSLTCLFPSLLGVQG